MPGFAEEFERGCGWGCGCLVALVIGLVLIGICTSATWQDGYSPPDGTNPVRETDFGPAPGLVPEIPGSQDSGQQGPAHTNDGVKQPVYAAAQSSDILTQPGKIVFQSPDGSPRGNIGFNSAVGFSCHYSSRCRLGFGGGSRILRNALVEYRG